MIVTAIAFILGIIIGLLAYAVVAPSRMYDAYAKGFLQGIEEAASYYEDIEATNPSFTLHSEPLQDPPEVKITNSRRASE